MNKIEVWGAGSNKYTDSALSRELTMALNSVTAQFLEKTFSPDVWVGVCYTEPSERNHAECSWKGYARQRVTFRPIPHSRGVQSTDNATFTQKKKSLWDRILSLIGLGPLDIPLPTHFGLFDKQTGGNILAWGSISEWNTLYPNTVILREFCVSARWD